MRFLRPDVRVNRAMIRKAYNLTINLDQAWPRVDTRLCIELVAGMGYVIVDGTGTSLSDRSIPFSAQISDDVGNSGFVRPDTLIPPMLVDVDEGAPRFDAHTSEASRRSDTR